MRNKTKGILVTSLVTAALSLGIVSGALWKETRVQAESVNIDAAYNGDLSAFDSQFETVYALPHADTSVINRLASHIATNKNNVIVDGQGNKALKMSASVAGLVAIRYYVGDLTAGTTYKLSMDAKCGSAFDTTRSLTLSLRNSSATVESPTVALSAVGQTAYTNLSQTYTPSAAQSHAYFVIYFSGTVDTADYLILDNIKLEKQTSDGVYETAVDSNDDFDCTTYLDNVVYGIWESEADYTQRVENSTVVYPSTQPSDSGSEGQNTGCVSSLSVLSVMGAPILLCGALTVFKRKENEEV